MIFFSGKAQKVFIIVVSRGDLIMILKHIWDLYLINPIIIYWIWTCFLKESAPHISISLTNVVDKSLKSEIFEQDWKNARVTPIYKEDGDFKDENNHHAIAVIGHIAKMIESLVSYQIIDFLDEHNLAQWINLLIGKDKQATISSSNKWLAWEC